MTKSDALLNAVSVYSWASLFGHGSLIQLTNWTTDIELQVHFDYGDFNIDREDDYYRSVVIAGAKMKWESRDDLRIDILRITWVFDKTTP